VPGPWPVVLISLIVLAAALLAGALPRPAWAHLVFAVAVLPLIMTAMIQFVPVLTRGTAPRRAVLALPLLGALAGVFAFAAFARATPTLYPAALLGLAASLGLLVWGASRGRSALGGPHPCLYWYLAALAALALGLAAALLTWGWPGAWPALRRFHLHINLLGFVGLTALGTLWVLLPTAAGYAEPAAAARLRGDLAPAAAGTLLIGAGAAWLPALAGAGLLLWAIVLGRFCWPLFAARRRAVWGLPGPARALGIAALGLAVSLVAGALHGFGAIAPGGALPLFVLGFVLPLVTGAASQLLPVWRWGPDRERQTRARALLSRGAALRAAVLLAAGVGAALGWSGGVYVAAAVLAVFLGQAAAALRGRPDRAAG
jgi:hypothetical protein